MAVISIVLMVSQYEKGAVQTKIFGHLTTISDQFPVGLNTQRCINEENQGLYQCIGYQAHGLCLIPWNKKDGFTLLLWNCDI